MNDFDKSIGAAIRNHRQNRGLTQKELVAKYELVCGQPLTVAQLSMWENGKVSMYAEQAYNMCKALNCSPMSLVDDKASGPKVERIQKEVTALPEEIVNIFYYAVTKWYGNTKALWKFVGLYLALPQKLRQTIAEIGCIMYKAGKETGQISKSAPPVDIAYIEQETRRLW